MPQSQTASFSRLAGPGHLGVLGSPHGGGQMARRLLPAVIVVPSVLGWLRILGEGAGLYSSTFGAVMMICASILLLGAAVYRTASELDRVDVARARATEELITRESELAATNRFLDAVVENVPNMLFVKDAEHLVFARLNRAGEQLLGVNRSELLGKTDYDLFPPEQAAFFQSKDRETLSGRVVVEIPEELVKTADGERWLHTKKVPILDVDGKPMFLLGISEDITERRRVDAAIRQAKEEAEATTRELETFSYSVSHDLRTPLRSIDGFSQALLEDYSDRLDETGRDYLARVRAAAQRMAELIDDLLQLSRVARAQVASEEVDLTALARAIVAELRAAAPERDVEVAVQDSLRTKGDPRLLRIALTNLIDNAWKFTSKKEKARIEIGASGDAGSVVFYVKDNGAGFDMAYASKLFGPFQRLHAPTDFDGTGIGLATVQRIIHKHGGRVWAEADLGRGATFRFTVGEHS